MKIRLITTLTALSLTALTGTSLHAAESGVTLEWQQPGYVMDVIVVSAARPALEPAAIQTDAAATADVAQAWQEPDYVMEVVVVTASRSEVLAEARKAAIEAAKARDTLFRKGAAWRGLGALPR